MKCSLGISNFLEEISSLSHFVLFLYLFSLITEEGFLISSCYSLELCIQILISFLFSPKVREIQVRRLVLQEGIRGQTHWNHNHRKLANLITWTTALSNSMKPSHAMWGHQDGWVMVERSDRMWSIGEGNGKPLQYSCLENPMNSMKRQNDRILKEELPRS